MKCFVCGDVVPHPENFIDEDTVLCQRCAMAEAESVGAQLRRA